MARLRHAPLTRPAGAAARVDASLIAHDFSRPEQRRRPSSATRGVVAALLACALPVAAAHAETLEDAIAIAYAHNPTLVQQRYLLRSTDEDYVQARAQYGPTLQVQATAQYARTDQLGIVQNSNAGQAVGTISQPLYTAGRLRGQLNAAAANVDAGTQRLRQVEQQTVLNVIVVYAQVLRDQQRLEVGRENVAVLQDQLRGNRERYLRMGRGEGAGDVTLTDIGLADARLAGAETTLASLEQQLSVSRGQYLQIVGQNPGTLEPLPALANMPGSIDAAFLQAEAANPALLTAKYVERASGASAAATRGSLGPQVSLTAQGVYRNQITPFDGRLGTKEFVAGVTVSQPLFASGALRSQVRQADAQNGADQAAVETARRSAIESVTEAWSQLVAARVSLTAGERQMQSAQLSFAGMRREELDGLRSTLDTLNVEQELVSAQLTFLQNQYAEYVARASLLSAVGGLRPDSIVRGLPAYDANAYFRKVRHRGETPLEAVARTVDRIGAPGLTRPRIADLNGENSPKPDAMPALPPTPGPETMQRHIVPVTQSRLVPASELPGGLPRTGELPPAPALPAGPTGATDPATPAGPAR